ncbi:MAG: M23 family metallopeptidase [Clostridia bacterium]|nr:M23 family metallopeptidase [Clostridia bacterium]
MSENSTLHIHTQMPPEGATEIITGRALGKRRGRRRDDFRRSSAPSAEPCDPASRRSANRAHSKKAPSQREPARQRARKNGQRAAPRPRLSFNDRLLRNSAIACAVLLGVLALGNIHQPWAEKASESIERALTMRINLDDSLGELTFVRSLMPESALVFLNVSGGTGMVRPVDGAVSHAWSALQPWTLFEDADAPVCAVSAGTVTAVSPLSSGQYGVLLDHGEGVESVYANLGEVSVASGDTVGRGDALGTCAGGLYFELLSGGESIDPAERLGL